MVTVDTAENIQAIEKTVQATQAITSTLEDVDALAIEAGIWFQAGYISEAFYVVEQGLQKHPNEDAFKKLYTQYYEPSNPLK